MKPGLLRLLIRWASITASVSALLLLAAGTTHIASIRHYLAIFSAILLVTMFSVDPGLAQERGPTAGKHPRQRQQGGRDQDRIFEDVGEHVGCDQAREGSADRAAG